MNTKIFSLSVPAILCLTFSATAAEVRGIVVKADAKNHQLVIEGRGRGLRGTELTFQLNKDTVIQNGQEPAQASDLTPGKRVRVFYERQDGQRVALRITMPGGALAEALKQAPPAEPAKEPAKSGPNDANTVSGTLRRLALTDREIVVVRANPAGGPDIETTIFVPESAKIDKDGKAIRLEELKEGLQVSVKVEKDHKEIVAKSIQLGAVVASPKSEAPPNRGDAVKKARMVLKIIDAFLGSMDRP
jgi:hypothetical protein